MVNKRLTSCLSSPQKARLGQMLTGKALVAFILVGNSAFGVKLALF